MSTTTVGLKKKKPNTYKKKKSFPWLGLILVILGLASVFYFMDRGIC